MKLGLIAMSGVRAYDKELTALGLTLPGFVERNKIIASLPSLALLTLAGMIPDGIDITYLEVPDLDRLGDLPGEFDVVAISSYSAQIKDAYTLASRYRREGTRVILGGPHVSAMQQEASSYADSIVIGEAEPVWPQLISDLISGTLEPVYDSTGSSFNMADAPMPRYDLLNPDNYNRITVQTQRGCPFECEFCASSIRMSPQFKFKPVDRVIDEIRQIKEIWSEPFIEFADDNTFANKAHGKRLLRAIAKQNIRWFTETDLSIADDDELLGLLGDSGCSQVLIGLESPVHSRLDGIEAKSNWKAQQVDRYYRAVDKIQSVGVTVNGCFILGLDGSGPDEFAEVAKFVRDSGLYEVQVTIQTAFPGTPLYDRLRAEERLIDNTAWETCTLFDLNYYPQTMPPDAFRSSFHRLVSELYSADETQRRRRNYIKKTRSKHV